MNAIRPAHTAAQAAASASMSRRAARVLAMVLVIVGPGVALEQANAQQRGKQPAPTAKKYDKQFPTGATFTLTSLNGKPPPAGAIATFSLDGAWRGAGKAGCNNWSATMWPQPGQRFATAAPATTRMACPPAMMAFERAYLRALLLQPQWDINGDTLTVNSRGGKLVFRRGF